MYIHVQKMCEAQTENSEKIKKLVFSSNGKVREYLDNKYNNNLILIMEKKNKIVRKFNDLASLIIRKTV